ncbi:MAG: hypothetical protein AAF845_16685 [Bacteroidota bacterium]
MRAFLALGLVAALAGCSGASIDEAYGQPDAFDWTYFHGEAGDVVVAIQETLSFSGLRVESVREEAGGILVTLGARSGRAEFSQILVQATDVEDYTARAQIYPVQARLPRWLEMEVSGRI